VAKRHIKGNVAAFIKNHVSFPKEGSMGKVREMHSMLTGEGVEIHRGHFGRI
jgi:hypothetical protein